MAVVVSGSIAYDYIMDYPGVFAEHILPEHLHSLSVCFTVGQLQKNSGGTGLNMAYLFGQLGVDHRILGACGSDFDYPHKDIVNYEGLAQHDDVLTPSAHIITDKNNNQITAFFPGAMERAADVGLTSFDGLQYAVISPNDKDAMLAHARQAEAANLRIFFQPGQQSNVLDGDELAYLISVCDYLSVNEYELSLLCEKTGFSREDIMEKVSGLIVTQGAEGSFAVIDGKEYQVGAVPTDDVVDPTGAGDSYLAGLVSGLVFYNDWKKAMQMASVCAHFCIQEYGTQNYRLDKEMVETKMRDVYEM